MGNKVKSLTIGVSIIAIISLGGVVWFQKTSSGKLDGFAQCLKGKGAIFYGAFWCSHCQSQKALFGDSQKYISYVECSTPDGKKQVEECNKEGIKGYPTWKFSDGSIVEGELSLQELSEKTSCPLP